MIEYYSREVCKIKVIIFSDSHKKFSTMLKAIELEGNIDQVIHAGDVHSDVEDLAIMYPKTPIAFVKGNNDPWLYDVPEDRLFELGGVKIFLTHGHNYTVKYSTLKLLQKAKSVGAQIAIFGHTHRPFHEKIDGITLFNPGASHRSYGVLEILDVSFNLTIKELS